MSQNYRMPTETCIGNENTLATDTFGRENFTGFVYSGGGTGADGDGNRRGAGGGMYVEFSINDLSVFAGSSLNVEIDDTGHVAITNNDGDGLVIPCGKDGSDGGAGATTVARDDFSWATFTTNGGNGAIGSGTSGGGGGGCGGPTDNGHNAALSTGGAGNGGLSGAGGNGGVGAGVPSRGSNYGGGGGAGGAGGGGLDGQEGGVAFVSISYDVIPTSKPGAAHQLLLRPKTRR